jgi:hypothetical protein
MEIATRSAGSAASAGLLDGGGYGGTGDGA